MSFDQYIRIRRTYRRGETIMLKLYQKALSFNFFDVGGQFHIQIATIMKLKKPPSYDHVEFPERRRLRVLQKMKMVDDRFGIIKMPKMLYWMRGPELVHNRIVYGDFAIQALGGGRLTHRQAESVRTVILRRMNEKQMFAEWRIPSPWQPVGRKGVGIRMGSGKAKPSKHVVPIRPGRIIMEVGGKCEYEEVKDFMTSITKVLPFESRIVSRDLLEKEEEKEELLEKSNRNPFTFKQGVKDNLLGINQYLSPYDYKWHGKYR